MEHAKKMVVVPQELLARLEQRMTPPAADGSLDIEMQRILNDKSVKDDGERWKRYQQVLHRFLNISTANRQSINLPIVESAEEETDQEHRGGIEDKHIIESFPVIYRNEARPLLDALKRRGQISWDRNGVLYVKGEQVADSNIVDILHSIVRVKKVSTLPTGWHEVMQVIKDMNIPSTYIGNQTATDFLNRQHTPAQDTLIPRRLSLPPTPDSTPRSRQSTQRRANTSFATPSHSAWESFRN